MKVLIKNGTLIDPVNYIKDKLDIVIEDSIVVDVGKKLNVPDAKYVIDAKGFIVSPGFVDLHANFCDPGVTSREDLKTGSISAVKGGFTHVLLGTENKPAASECNVIEYIKKYAYIMPVNIYPSASVTINREGEEIADINFLYNHGAVGFYDGQKPILNKILLEKVMKNIAKLNSILSIYSEVQEKVKVRGVIEGDTAKKLGIKGAVPEDAEVDDLKENIALAKYLGCKLDLAYISSEKSIVEVENAKKSGQEIFAEVPAINLILNDKALEKYGAYAKVLPPLRSESNRKALIKALKNGIIDIVSSNHMPIDKDEKELKLKDASSGCIGTETLLGICGAILVEEGGFTWKDVIEKISVNPAKCFGLDKFGVGVINKGKIANITIFDPNEKWTLTEDNIVSKSHNTPLIGMQLIGKVKYTICNGKLVYRDISLEERND